ncbi:glutamyl-tRNA reductase [bacterium]|nr:glutamyl-tRNA reductase [bacterium]MBU1983373.1 glutamyl-tRNA reductase [bacterium]
MKFEMIGLNHTTSTLEVRDRAAISSGRLEEVATRLLQEPYMEGVVILSTCNRVELYFSPSYHSTDQALYSRFAESCNLSPAEARAAYIHRDGDAVHHIFRVASGLDSQLIGETQILTQVKQAYHSALDLACSNALLNRVFLRAIECGKMIRSRTAISRGAVSVSFAAVNMAERVFGHLKGRRILLIGAGETIRLAMKHLMNAGAESWRISNRTRAHAERLAETLNAAVVSFPPHDEDLAWADIIVSATGSPQVVVSADQAARALSSRNRSGPLLILDLAVPRDVDPAFRSDNAYVYSVDDFRQLVEANLKARQREAVRAEKLVRQSVEDFVVWYKAHRVLPTIQQLQEVLEEIRTEEIERNARRFSAADREQVELFSKILIKKVATLIIVNMKQASVERNDLSLASAVSLAFAGEDKEAVENVLEQLKHELSH